MAKSKKKKAATKKAADKAEVEPSIEDAQEAIDGDEWTDDESDAAQAVNAAVEEGPKPQPQVDPVRSGASKSVHKVPGKMRKFQ